MELISSPTHELSPDQLAEVRALCDAAWSVTDETFDDNDWRSAQGGMHFILSDGGAMVSHGSVVERVLELDGRSLRAGYVEAVATLPARQGEGLGTIVIREITAFIDRTYELGALNTGVAPFYERLGWRRWPGRTGVRTAGGLQLTPEEDGGVFVRYPGEVPATTARSLLTCDWRPGEVW
jgi:aminoglycoside 2'-N-acetyltransferase I